jgi:type 2 lantibiotic biosynthesis protein LanM
MFSDATDKACLGQSPLSPQPDLTPDEPSLDEFGFVAVARPLVTQMLEHASGCLLRLTTSTRLFCAASVRQRLWTEAIDVLRPLVEQTLTEQLNHARRGRPPSASTEHELHAFFRRLPHLGRPFETTPVVPRLLALRAQLWCAAFERFIDRLIADWPAIERKRLVSTDRLEVVSFDAAGDEHRGSQVVRVIRFDQSALVYKPHSVSVDERYDALLQWLTSKQPGLRFRSRRLLDLGTHGWTEYVRAEPCQTHEDAIAFYERLGAQLALVHLLQGTDFHVDNLVAAGAFPVLVDVEALFHQPLVVEPTDRLKAALEASVIGTGLVPTSASADDQSGIAGHRSNSEWGLRWVDDGLVRRREEGWVSTPTPENAPSLAGARLDPHEFIEPLRNGFRQTLRCVIEHREALLASGGPLDAFEGAETRVILRPTRIYAMLLNGSRHPSRLESEEKQRAHFDRLVTLASPNPMLMALARAEVTALAQGDIPTFRSSPDSRCLTTDDGEDIEVFEDSALTQVRQRLRALDETAVARQDALLRGALRTLEIESTKGRVFVEAPLSPGAPVERAALEAEAERIVEQLRLTAVRAGGLATWFGLSSTRGESYRWAPVRADLYEGLPGIALCLAAAAKAFQRPTYATLAHEAARTWETLLPSHPATHGLYGGLGGALLAIDRLTQYDIDLTAHLPNLIGTLTQSIEQDLGLDVVAGAAGTVLAALAVNQPTHREALETLAFSAGEHLRRQLFPEGRLKNSLTGFAHGATGYALAFGLLEQLAPGYGFRDACAGALAFEREHFDEQRGNWRDLRAPERTDFATSWCYGAPGVVLALLALPSCVSHLVPENELAAAAVGIERDGFGKGHCLCHGDVGNLEALAALARRGFGHVERPRQLAGAVVAQMQTHGWLSGAPLGAETPGLMMGLAGMGYGLLSLAQPDVFPTLLVGGHGVH